MTTPFSYECRKCSLLFLPEETSHRFNTHTHMCARCTLSLLEIKLPNCFGLKYESSDLTCTAICKIKEACLIQTLDHKAIDWSLKVDHQYHSLAQMPLAQHTVRILRSVGRPLHWMDIGPILNKITNQRLRLDPRQYWAQTLQKNLKHCPDIVDLGNGFYVWIGCWVPSMGGTFGKTRSVKKQQKK